MNSKKKSLICSPGEIMWRKKRGTGTEREGVCAGVWEPDHFSRWSAPKFSTWLGSCRGKMTETKRFVRGWIPSLSGTYYFQLMYNSCPVSHVRAVSEYGATTYTTSLVWEQLHTHIYIYILMKGCEQVSHVCQIQACSSSSKIRFI